MPGLQFTADTNGKVLVLICYFRFDEYYVLER